jgi:hypothetical protein
MQEEATREEWIFMITSEVVITLIIFIGVYFIFKPVFGKKDDNSKDNPEAD